MIPTQLMRSWMLAALGMLLTFPVVADDGSGLCLKDLTRQSKIQFEHRDGSSGKYFLVEAVAAGLASLDYDLDGRADIYFLNGAELPETHYSSPPRNALVRNLGAWQFMDVSQPSHLDSASFSLGVCVGDINEDGFPDVYVSNLGSNQLFLNLGDGTFVELAEDSALGCGDKAGAGCNMLDIDGDGDLDVFASSYMLFDPNIPASVFRGRTVYGGPLLYPKASDNLLRNNGDSSFTDATKESGIGDAREWGMGSICLDYDGDGDTDIFVANDSTRNLLYENDGTGSFLESALLTGVAYDHRGDPQGSMGVDAADYNGDGRLDLIQTAYTKQLATLYENLDGGFFEDVTLRTGAGTNTFFAVNWGVAFVDLENDGDKDIFLANGHIHDNLDDLDDTVQYKIPNQVLINQDGKRFFEPSAVQGDGLAITESSRGLVAEDLDQDGRLDLVVLNSRTLPSIIRNETSPTGRWLELDLVGFQDADGKACNRSAVGSRVEISAKGRTQILEVHSGRGYQSHFGSRLHFGLGDADIVDYVRVHWHSGGVSTFEKLAPNALYLIRQSIGIERMEPTP